MKVAIGVIGLLIGVFFGVALLLLNPITLMKGAPRGLSGAVRTLSWQTGGSFRGFDLTPEGLLGADNDANPALDFREPGIRYARVEVVPVAGEAGAPTALGIRLSAIGRENSLLKARLGVVTAWNLVWPGQGSMLLAGSENFLAPMRDGLWSAVRGRGFQPSQAHYPLPPIYGLGRPALIGGTGEFAGAKGGFREDMEPMRERPGDLTGRRQLQIAIE